MSSQVKAIQNPYIPCRQQDAINKFFDLLNTMLAVKDHLQPREEVMSQ